MTLAASAFVAFESAALAAEHVHTYSTQAECEREARIYNTQVPSNGYHYYCAKRDAGGFNLWRYRI
ncbi:hypothetical protein GCM10022267_75360 [Lentzea roselyniae]|uniref:Uncharacterized protein n=1 Tax=Lentzea roselyniae TaxID=531940 RepID=A0ABP7C4K0_9PSEU